MFTISPARSSCLAVLKIIFFLLNLHNQNNSESNRKVRNMKMKGKKREKHSKLDPTSLKMSSKTFSGQFARNLRGSQLLFLAQVRREFGVAAEPTRLQQYYPGFISLLPTTAAFVIEQELVTPTAKKRREASSRNPNPHDPSPQLKSLVLTYKNLIFPDLVKQIYYIPLE